ncbi:hypothetical protein LBMAG42_41910 [Deltaproteobacteria bacterium]|nr:hypothetical protein LBMAG42_41910 [Deltaproteobacteria bacterium]
MLLTFLHLACVVETPADTGSPGHDSGTDTADTASGSDTAETGDTADTGDTGDTAGTGLANELATARAAWEGCGYASYSFVLQYLCFCPEEMAGPARITVIDGVIDGATYVTSGEPVDASFAARDVPALFALIDEAITRPADQITVTWDESCGYPTQSYLDYELDADDEELGFSVAELVGM